MIRTATLVSISLLACGLALGCTQATQEPFGTAESAVKASSKSGGAGGGGPAEKVAICHVPPGNPDNAHTIVVGAAAVEAHLAHGDALGECPDDDDDDCHCQDGSSSSSASGGGEGGCDGIDPSANE